MRMYVLSLAIAAFGLLGLAAPAGASCIKDALGCANAVVCRVGAQAGLQCVDR